MRRIGIIDLGSNTIRLVVYEPRRDLRSNRRTDGELSFDDKWSDGGKRPFRELMDKKKVAGLSAYVVDEHLTPQGIERAIDVLKGLERAADGIGCDKVHVFATAVVRNCRNSKQAAEQIGKGAGVKLDVLSAEEEAHLGFVGATCDRRIADGTLIDIGGGSTELTAIRNGRDVHDLSIPQGSVSSYAEFVSLILPKPEEADSIREAFASKLDGIKGLDDFESARLYGIGGSVRAIDKLYAAAYMDGKRLQTLDLEQVERLRKLLRKDPSRFAHAATKAVPERMHTVTPGMVIVHALMKRLDAQTLEVCKYGVREGYLLERVLKM